MTLAELKEDAEFLRAVKECAERAHAIAVAQSGEIPGKHDFVWGFWLGASYAEAGILRTVRACIQSGHHHDHEEPPR